MSTIDKIRNSSIQMQICDEEDISDIDELISIGKNVYLVTKNSVYRMELADEIDPERTNPHLPKSSYKKVLTQGSDSPIIGKVLLTAAKLFDSKILGTDFDSKSLLQLALELSDFIIEMDKIKNSLSENICTIQKNPIKPQEDGSVKIPVTINLKKDCESFIKKFDLVRDDILKIFEIFYPIKSGNDEKVRTQNLIKKIEERHGTDSTINMFFGDLSKSLSTLRNWRNALEHPDSKKEVIIHDFKLTKERKIDIPSIEILHQTTPQTKTEIVNFFSEIVTELTNYVELVMAQVCSQNSIVNIACGVMEVPLERRGNKFVRFRYATKLGDEIVPLG